MKESEPFVEHKKEGLYGTFLREPTADELKASMDRRATLKLLRDHLDQLKSEIKQLEKDCTCTVSVDLPGFPYDLRMCHACGASQGRV